MTRRDRLNVALATLAAAVTVSAASTAFAQDYGNSAGQAAGGAIVIFTYCCIGLSSLLGLALFALWVWMLIDVIGRQEYEFPNSSGNSKNTWLIILIVSIFVSFYWLAAILYYFMVFKKIKRGTVAPQWAGQTPPAPPVAPPAPPAPPATPPAPPAPPVE